MSDAAASVPEPRSGAQLGQHAASSPPGLYARITETVIAMLESGVVPWRSPILGQNGSEYPRNLSGRRYRGVNVFLLAFAGYSAGYAAPIWLTFRQAAALGGRVRKGEKGTLVIFWKPEEVVDRGSGEVRQRFVVRHYHVFNLEQCEEVGIAAPPPPSPPTEAQRIAAADAIVRGYRDGPGIHHGGVHAFYVPAKDEVHIPDPSRFTSPQEYYSTLFHELAHSTGHSSRLDRKLVSQQAPFGTADYGREELVAELAAAYLCGDCGIHPAVIENQTAYIAGWLGKLRKDSRLVLDAASAAQRAADRIRGFDAATADQSGPSDMTTPV